MRRRQFLAALMASSATTRLAGLQKSAGWRTFEVTTRLELIDARSPARAWIPLPLPATTIFQRDLGHRVSGNARQSKVVPIPAAQGSMIAAEWGADATPVIEVTARVSTSDYRVPLAAPVGARVSESQLAPYRRATALIPIDGIVRDTATRITRGHRTDLARARAIYDWIVENTRRNPDVKGCGLGDIRWMLETNDLSGKCADLNALFVGLARASGLAARDLYGLRVAPSQHFPSLGRAGGNVTTAQHCRAEVFADGHGWIPVDPADVRKLILEERPGATLSDAYVAKVRDALFGSWEMNWIAYNDAHDVELPGSTGKPLPFLMYPQAEVGGARRESLEPDRFRYSITAREL